MDDYFGREFSTLEREIRQLKTAAIKSSANVETVATTIAVSIPLSISSSQTYCRGYTYYKVSCERDSIVMVTLDWYHTDIMVEWQTPRITRSIEVHKCMLSDGSFGIELIGNGTTYSTDGTDDLSRLRNGQSVSIAANMTVRATNNFAVEQINV